MEGKAVIISAPSGAGKTTIVKHLLQIKEMRLAFSVSACTRPIRPNEEEGKDYYFLTVNQFKDKIDDGEFLEWEEVYKNNYYGTLRGEVSRIWSLGMHVLFDVDVMGGINLKEKFGDNALAIFIRPPSLDVLRSRLESRGTESAEKIRNRMNKASLELKFARKFDVVVLNDELEKAQGETQKLIAGFLKK